jgi:hypothetical protein
MSTPPVIAMASLEALSDFVRRTLCEHDRLDPEQTPLFHTVVKRTGKPCGILFHIEGPRLLKNSALWAGDEHRILFYDCNGVRFQEVRLSESPELAAEGAPGSMAAPST